MGSTQWEGIVATARAIDGRLRTGEPLEAEQVQQLARAILKLQEELAAPPSERLRIRVPTPGR
jgi:hypothetical protein